MNTQRPLRAQPTLWSATLDPADHAALDPGMPDKLDRHPDVVVVGGGVIGLATALFCRRAGLSRAPSVADMLSALRRVLLAAQYLPSLLVKPTHHEILRCRQPGPRPA